jgi:hypothetical protein
MHLAEMQCVCVDWMQVLQDRVQRWAFMNILTTPWVPLKVGNSFLKGCAPWSYLFVSHSFIRTFSVFLSFKHGFLVWRPLLLLTRVYSPIYQHP